MHKAVKLRRVRVWFRTPWIVEIRMTPRKDLVLQGRQVHPLGWRARSSFDPVWTGVLSPWFSLIVCDRGLTLARLSRQALSRVSGGSQIGDPAGEKEGPR